MIDIAWTALDYILTYTVNPDWGKSVPIEGDEEAWANSSQEIVFGDKTSWTFGLGCTTNIFGPRVDFNVDYSYLIKNIEKVEFIGKGRLGAGLVGSTGYFSFTLGPETSISYGASDLALQRKKHADQEFEIIFDDGGPETKTPKPIIWANLICTGLMVSAIAMVRFNHFTGFLCAKNKKLTEEVNKAINDVVKLVQPRFLAILAKMELAYHAKHYLEKTLKEIQDTPATIKEYLKNGTAEMKSDVEAVLRKLEWNKKFNSDMDQTKADINTQIDVASARINEQISFVGSIVDLFQEKRPNWSETNRPIGMRCQKYELVADGRFDSGAVPGSKDLPGKIRFNSQSHTFDADGNSQGIKNQSNFALESKSIRLELMEGSKQISNLYLDDKCLNIDSKPGVSITSSDGNSDSSNIYVTNCSINAQCGDDAKGPSIEMDGKNSQIIVSVGTKDAGCAIGIADKRISIGHLGIPQKPFMLPKIILLEDKIVMSAGISTIQLTKDGILLKSGTTSLELKPTKLKEMSAIIEQQAEMKKQIKTILKKLSVTAIDQKTSGIDKTN